MGNAINDKYFTKPSTVDLCLNRLNFSDYDLIFEPSAGCGSFLNKLPKEKTSAADISPDIPEVVQLDFYSIEKVINLLDLRTNREKKYLSIGNPPFGNMAQIAIDFFNGCALFSDTIAFILPRTFRKISVTNRLALDFHLREEMLLPKHSFLVMNPSSPTLTSEYDVPCVFQIWDKSETNREKTQPKNESEHLTFVKDIKKAEYAFRRVGADAGGLYHISSSSRSMSASSHYYINCSEQIAQIIQNIEWKYGSSKYDTAGNPSISKNELITRLETIIMEEQWNT